MIFQNFGKLKKKICSNNLMVEKLGARVSFLVYKSTQRDSQTSICALMYEKLYKRCYKRCIVIENERKI